jgi:hypothetical protein
MDRGGGLFAGLNVLPKTAWFSSYSSATTREMNVSLKRVDILTEKHQKYLHVRKEKAHNQKNESKKQKSRRERSEAGQKNLKLDSATMQQKKMSPKGNTFFL